MESNQIKDNGVLTKLLEKGIKIFIKKECKNVGKVNIDIYATSLQVIKGKIKKILIKASDINYKELLFDEIELEAKEIKIKFKINNMELKFKNDLFVKFKISLSSNSLKSFLSSNSWSWVKKKISNELLNRAEIEDIKVKDGEIVIAKSKEKNCVNGAERLNIKAVNGKFYIENKTYKKSIIIPIEDKILIKGINIKNNLIIISASSPVSF